SYTRLNRRLQTESTAPHKLLTLIQKQIPEFFLMENILELHQKELMKLNSSYQQIPSEDLKPLAKVASGGEVSRIMLSLKSTLAKNDKLPLLIFDEIDVGVSGRIAQKVGKALKESFSVSSGYFNYSIYLRLPVRQIIIFRLKRQLKMRG
ncbi:MAG: hypothetical protein MZV64_30505, partial [Ignavibacteriales bacterium]|nr:hypothetical protein [Ignavibacteriales bacterium]